MKNNSAPSVTGARLTRRDMLVRTGAAALGLGVTGWPMISTAQSAKRRVLFFSKSSGFEHSVIQRKGGRPSFAENVLAELAPKHGIEFVFSKDGSLFSPEYLAGFGAYVFYTTGDLTTAGTDGHPPMSTAGKAALLEAVSKGKGFIGVHSATDTFHTPEPAAEEGAAGYKNDGAEADPYIRMVGAEFISHGSQQKATMRVTDSVFPGLPRSNFALLEEWYSFKNIASDLHVLLVQETEGMNGKPYRRPPYPATWARRHGQGRVFYTSLGHREDVWTNPLFENLLFGGLSWALGGGDVEIRTNVEKVTPGYTELPPR